MIKLKHIDYELLPDYIRTITQSGYKALVEDANDESDIFDTWFFDICIMTGAEDNEK